MEEERLDVSCDTTGWYSMKAISMANCFLPALLPFCFSFERKPEGEMVG